MLETLYGYIIHVAGFQACTTPQYGLTAPMKAIVIAYLSNHTRKDILLHIANAH